MIKNTNYPLYILSKLFNNYRFRKMNFSNSVYFKPDSCRLKHNLGFSLRRQTICKIKSFLLKLYQTYHKWEYHRECFIFQSKFYLAGGQCLVHW